MPSRFFTTVHSLPATAKSMGMGKFGAQVVTFQNGVQGILKVKPFATDAYRGIPKQEMPAREYAAYILDRDVLDFGVVPETLLMKWRGREASIQEFVHSGRLPREMVPGLFDRSQPDWKQRIAKLFMQVNLDDMLKVLILDLVVNNTDRHGKNVLVDRMRHKVWAIDNGLSFGRYYKHYRSIFHKYLMFSRFRLPEWAVKKLARIDKDSLDVLRPLLPAECVEDTWLRIKFILDHQDRLAYRRMGAVDDLVGVSQFPSYAEWFKRQEYDDAALVLVDEEAA